MRRLVTSLSAVFLLSSLAAGCVGLRYADASRRVGQGCEEDSDCITSLCVDGVCVADTSGEEPTTDGGASVDGGSSGPRTDGGSSGSGGCAYFDDTLGRILCEQRSSASSCTGKFFGSGTTCVGLSCPLGSNDPFDCILGGTAPPKQGQVVVWTNQPVGWKPTGWKGPGDGLHNVMTVSVSSFVGGISAGQLSSPPACGATYAFTRSLYPGDYSVDGTVYFLKDMYGNSYSPYRTSASFTIRAGECTQVLLR